MPQPPVAFTPTPLPPVPRGIWWTMIALIASAPVLLFISWGLTLEQGWPEPYNSVRMLLDPALGVVAIALVPRVLHRDSGPPAWAVDERRERRALWFGLATILCSGWSGMAMGAAVVAFVSLAARRRGRWIAAAVAALAVVGLAELGGDNALPWWELALTVVVLAATLVLLGLYRGSRRDLLRSLRREAEAARVAGEARDNQARQEERTRIAREMHDTISHRLALVALHAGALEYRDDLSGEQVRETAGVIRQGVQEAADELRSTLMVLRSDGSDTRPAASLSDLTAMVDEVRRAGADVTLHLAVTGPGHDADAGGETDAADEPDAGAGGLAGDAPPAASAHVHRVVQESLTNAVKHAPGLPIRVVVEGGPGDGVRVEVRNPLPRERVEASGSRVGLVGLRERIALVGGTFGAGAEGGEFVVRAWVPWKN